MARRLPWPAPVGRQRKASRPRTDGGPRASRDRRQADLGKTGGASRYLWNTDLALGSAAGNVTGNPPSRAQGAAPAPEPNAFCSISPATMASGGKGGAESCPRASHPILLLAGSASRPNRTRGRQSECPPTGAEPVCRTRVTWLVLDRTPACQRSDHAAGRGSLRANGMGGAHAGVTMGAGVIPLTSKM